MKSLFRHLPFASSVDPDSLGLIFTIGGAVLILGVAKLRKVFRPPGIVGVADSNSGSRDTAAYRSTRGSS
jgi:hypothetical protein